MRATPAKRLTGLDGAVTGFVFPGQGSQHPGMSRAFERCAPGPRELVTTAEQVTGVPLEQLMSTGDADALAHPHVAQLAVFVASSVLHRELERRGIRPAVVAGHSVGEYAALAAAGVLDWLDALRLVDTRGAAMAAAATVRPGAMVAVAGLAHEYVAQLCRDATDPASGELVTIANVNSPAQLVVSGTTAAVLRVADAARLAGALRVSRLPVGGAYHSALMGPAAERMRAVLSGIELRAPRTPIVSSATGELVTDLHRYRAALHDQVLLPVRWRESVAALVGCGVRAVVEVGPGHVLSGLCRDNERTLLRVHADDLLARGVPEPAQPDGARVTAGAVSRV